MEDKIIERFGFATEDDAQRVLDEFVFDGYSGFVLKHQDGWAFRAFPPGFGSTEPANNVGAETSVNTPGSPQASTGGGLKNLLDFIADLESGGNYNAYFRHARNESSPKFTTMTLDKVLAWQQGYTQVAKQLSSAVGRYQMIRSTLQSLITSLGLSPSTTKFNESIQDTMAIKLMEEKGLEAFRASSKSAENFANDVAKVWAALPVVTDVVKPDGTIAKKGFSYYAGDGLNKALVGVESYMQAIASARA